ncbi:MAG: DUF4384 domain-containing protein [Planctomycetaceae bacterium]|nr:DUF4384 domain-containing protein [Planctomycetaceae bacterium]
MSRTNHDATRSAAMRLAIARLLAVVFSHSIATAQPPEPGTDVPAVHDTIQQQRPSFFVRAEVNHVTRAYAEGDAMSLQVVSEVDAFLYVLYKQADGKVFQIFPNSAQPENRVKGKQPVAVPAADDPFRWKIGPPFGKEQVLVVAARQPILELANPALRRERFNPVAKEIVEQVASRLKGAEPNQWTECLVELTTSPRREPAPATGPKRYGVFFGVSQYEFGRESGLDLKYCDSDALKSAETFRDVGRLNELQVFVNERATRANLERAITQWLPSVSRPGDTVFVFFSGHGSQILDDNGDEADHLDELLLPHDFWTLPLLASLAKKLEQGQLDEQLKPRVQAALKLVRGAGTSQKAAELLSRSTGVTDDLFGHWVQRLDGRQVVVILDSCMSGGFATAEKGEESPPKDAEKDKPSLPVPFDFLDSEVARLKDIGQKETALLAACHRNEVTLIREDLKHSVFTYHLLREIQQAQPPDELTAAYRDISQAMKNYFRTTGLQATNDRLQAAGTLPHAMGYPFLINNCSKPVHLRP